MRRRLGHVQQRLYAATVASYRSLRLEDKTYPTIELSWLSQPMSLEESLRKQHPSALPPACQGKKGNPVSARFEIRRQQQSARLILEHTAVYVKETLLCRRHTALLVV